jgi:hypothetical protein
MSGLAIEDDGASRLAPVEKIALDVGGFHGYRGDEGSSR